MNHQLELKTHQQIYQYPYIYGIIIHQQYYFIINNYNNNLCGDITPTTTLTDTTMQRHQLQMQYACGTILRALNDKHSRA